MSVRWSQTRPPLPETLPAWVPPASRLPLYRPSLFFPPPIIGAPPREAARTIESNEIPLSRVINIDYNRLYLLGRVEPPSRAGPLSPLSSPPCCAPPSTSLPRLITLLPTRFASSSATSGATAYLDAHIRCVSAPVILGFHRAVLIAIIVTPSRRAPPNARPSRRSLRSIFPAKASLIDVTGTRRSSILSSHDQPLVRVPQSPPEREKEKRAVTGAGPRVCRLKY